MREYEPNHAESALPMALGFVLCAICANALFYLVRYELGYGFGTFLGGPNDRFADLIKVALSFKSITAAIADTQAFQYWPSLFKDYLLHNPHGGIESLSANKLSHFQYPPLSALIFTICAIVIREALSPTAALWIWFILYLFGVIWLIKAAFPDPGPYKRPAIALAALCLISFPALFMLGRGNFHAGFVSILASIAVVSCYRRRQVSVACIFALAVAINVRPTAALFALAIPLVLGFRQAMAPLLKLSVLAGILFLASLAAEHYIYPAYTIPSFLKGLEIYRALYVEGPAGDGGNSSLWALIKNGARMADLFVFHEELWRIFLAGSALVVLLAARAVSGAGNGPAGPFVLAAAYVLLQPVCADYHLLVFVAPLVLLPDNAQGMPRDVKRRVILIASLLMLCPKNYFFIAGLSLQTLLNPTILLGALLLLNAEWPVHVPLQPRSRAGAVTGNMGKV